MRALIDQFLDVNGWVLILGLMLFGVAALCWNIFDGLREARKKPFRWDDWKGRE